MRLPTGTRFIREAVELEEIGSTNSYALEAGRPGLLVSALCQTAGRGSKGRSWFSPPGANLYLTLTLGMSDPRLSIVAGVAAREALSTVFGDGIPVEIKWPNDLIVGARKICGILCESRRGITAMGVGINVNQVDWPGELEGRATSIAMVVGREVPREEVFLQVASALEKWLAVFAGRGFDPVRRSFLAHGLLEGHELFTEERLPCSILDLSVEGHLVISTGGALRELVSGSIVVGR